MRPMLLTLLLLASLPTFRQTADSSQPEGTISGTVLNEHGQPFRGVAVCTYMPGAPSGSKEVRGDCPVTTDEAGQFRIDHMAMGTFGVEAIKPEDGYVAFAGTSVKEMVTLTPSQSSATVVLKLGPKPGVLLPNVKDKLTGEPIMSFQVSWEISEREISESPNRSYSGGQTIEQGIKRAIVPPEKFLLLTISARGYKKWIYHDPSDPSRPAFIRLQPGEEKELLVELEPQAPAAPSPQGRIIGSVVNDSNEPVGNAVLCTSVVNANSAHTSCGSQTADTQGHFDIIVPLETNRVFAENPQAGYQRPNNPMQEGVHVKLSEVEPVAHVEIKVGPRPAELTLTVTDRATGKPVDSFIVRWIRIDDGPITATDSRKSRVFVPPDVDLLLTVQAAGYERWFYSDVSAPSRPILHLASGEQKTISVELDPR